MSKFLDLTGLSYFWGKVKTYVDSAISIAKTTVDNYTINGKKISTNPTLSKGDVGLSNVTNDAQVKRSEMGVASGVATLDDQGLIPTSQLPSYVDDVVEFSNKKALRGNAKAQSTISVKDVVYNSTSKTFVATDSLISSGNASDYFGNWSAADSIPSAESYGNASDAGRVPVAGKIYVETSTGKTYRWNGTDLVEISPSLALGETSSTAYAGDKGKANRDAIESTPDTIISGASLGTVGTTTITLNVNKATKSGLNYVDPVAANITLPAATSSAAGLMSKDDKVKLTDLSNTPDATSTVAGKVKLGSDVEQEVAANQPTNTAGKTYPIQKNESGQLVVNVPWTDTTSADTKVTQNAVGTTDAAFNLLLAQTGGNTNAETGSVNKASGLTYNPSTKALSAGGELTAGGAVTGSTIKKRGGTSSQILMADGSVATAIPTEDIDSLFS